MTFRASWQSFLDDWAGPARSALAEDPWTLGRDAFPDDSRVVRVVQGPVLDEEFWGLLKRIERMNGGKAIAIFRLVGQPSSLSSWCSEGDAPDVRLFVYPVTTSWADIVRTTRSDELDVHLLYEAGMCEAVVLGSSGTWAGVFNGFVADDPYDVGVRGTHAAEMESLLVEHRDSFDAGQADRDGR